MKKSLSIILAAALMLVMLAGCAATANESAKSEEVYFEEPSSTTAYSADMKTEEAELFTEDSALIASVQEQKPDMSEKIIYTADAEVETTDFDNSVDNVYRLVDFYDGFIENSYVAGKNYDAEFYGYKSFRNASFTVRIPAKDFEGFKSSLETLGNVTGVSTFAQNVTTEYYDIHSRLVAYQTEEKTLLAMMEKTETVADMIEVEKALAEVRYNIESLQSTLKNMDNKVDYSTVNINLREVRELTRVTETPKSYWQELGDGFVYSLGSVGRFFKNAFREIVTNLPVILLIAAIAAAVIIFIIKLLARNPERAARREAKREAKRAVKDAKRRAKAGIIEDEKNNEQKDEEV